MRLTVALLVIISLALITVPTPKSNTNSTIVHVAPRVTWDASLGEEYSVDINVTDIADLYGWEFQLWYNSTILSVTSASAATEGLNEPTVTFFSSNMSGHFWWAVSTRFPTTTGVTYAEHAVFTIVFHAMATGTTALHLNGTILADSSGEAIPHTDMDYTIKVGIIGDINGDGIVNLFDAVIVSLAFNSTPSDTWWNSKADLNHDGIVNVLDGIMVAKAWSN